MTREKARELLPVIQAYAEGKTVQYECGGHWLDELAGDVSFTDHEIKWRVKPEPREFWLVRHNPGSSRIVYENGSDACGPYTELIHVREVL